MKTATKLNRKKFISSIIGLGIVTVLLFTLNHHGFGWVPQPQTILSRITKASLGDLLLYYFIASLMVITSFITSLDKAD